MSGLDSDEAESRESPRREGGGPEGPPTDPSSREEVEPGEGRGVLPRLALTLFPFLLLLFFLFMDWMIRRRS